ncbi:MAG: hypothetical protein HY298_06195 [Verrucomicrobia bacterium]|nr:hypothetical protein [Verrucomicrobiota bacterium]
MKKHLLTKSFACLLMLSALLLVPGVTLAQDWRLIGITGQQNDPTTNGLGDFVYPDRTLFQINPANAAIIKLFQPTFVDQGHVIGFCPTNGLVYHAAGAEAFTDNPSNVGQNQGQPDSVGSGYQDSQYLETIDLATRTLSAVYNADPCPNPDPTLPCFGLSAPRPSWVLPVIRRDSTQTASSYRLPPAGLGTNEYREVRGMAWSTNENLFYIADQYGIFKLTPSGDCTFLSRPAFQVDGSTTVSKAIAFVTVTNVTKLWVGHQKGSGANGYVMEIDTETGAWISELALSYPPGGGEPVDQFGGLLGLAQHPVTGVIYGIRKTDFNNFYFARELVTINPQTGATTLVGNLGMHFTSLAFVLSQPLQIQSVTRDGNDLSLTWSGSLPPYEVQSRASLSTGSWSTVVTNLVQTSVTITNGASGTTGFFRVSGQ